MSSTLSALRTAIAELGDTGMLIAADASEEQNTETGILLARLLRRYAYIQKNIRMNLPVEELLKEQAQDQEWFELLSPKIPGQEQNRRARYFKPLGPYYTRLQVDAEYLGNNFQLLSDEPVRELVVTNINKDDNFDMICRNYRIEYQFILEFAFLRNWHNRDNGWMSQLNARSCREIRVNLTSARQSGSDQLMAAFILNNRIPRGCQLIYNGTRVKEKKI